MKRREGKASLISLLLLFSRLWPGAMAVTQRLTVGRREREGAQSTTGERDSGDSETPFSHCCSHTKPHTHAHTHTHTHPLFLSRFDLLLLSPRQSMSSRPSPSFPSSSNPCRSARLAPLASAAQRGALRRRTSSISAWRALAMVPAGVVSAAERNRRKEGGGEGVRTGNCAWLSPPPFSPPSSAHANAVDIMAAKRRGRLLRRVQQKRRRDEERGRKENTFSLTPSALSVDCTAAAQPSTAALRSACFISRRRVQPEAAARAREGAPLPSVRVFHFHSLSRLVRSASTNPSSLFFFSSLSLLSLFSSLSSLRLPGIT